MKKTSGKLDYVSHEYGADYDTSEEDGYYDRSEELAKADELFNKLDWKVMDKHLHSDHARRTYEQFKQMYLRSVHDIEQISKARNLAYYHEKLYSVSRSKNSSKDKTIGKKPYGTSIAAATCDFLKKREDDED